MATATSNFMNKAYNGIFAPKFSVSMSKETIALVGDYFIQFDVAIAFLNNLLKMAVLKVRLNKTNMTVTYSQVHGSPVLKALLFESF